MTRRRIEPKYPKGTHIANDNCPHCGREVAYRLTIKNKVFYICQPREGGCGCRAFLGRAKSEQLIAEFEKHQQGANDNGVDVREREDGGDAGGAGGEAGAVDQRSGSGVGLWWGSIVG
jgi:hypothetical protein